MTRTLIATLAVLTAGVLAFAGLTRGFTVLTAESARRQAVAAAPIRIPDLVGINQRGARRRVFDPADRRVVIVAFIYTRCTSLCSALGSSYQQLQSAIEAQHLEHAVRLVTVSFDPARDTQEVIHEYGQRLGAKPDLWTILTPLEPEALRRSLDVYGVVAIPAPDGQFIHNAAFHIIDRHGRLARIIDISQPNAALLAARRLYGAS
jgi:protein SCO1/2